MRNTWFSVGALLVGAAVAAGAFGAHGLRQRLDAPSMVLWETAARYLAIGGFGLLAAGLAQTASPRRGWTIAAVSLSVGTLVFSGTVGAIALGGPRWLGAVTPVGGTLLIVGFIAMALAAVHRS